MDKDIEKILFTNEEIKTAVQKLGKIDRELSRWNLSSGILAQQARYDRLDTNMICYMEIDLWFPVTHDTCSDL